ncbi:AMP-binding protein, partial [Frankia nepalensis]|uniref:AMP-binding protein n=1 Tax=Frankia nepalensis TaxID=1836974 RepID=UPI001EE3C616
GRTGGGAVWPARARAAGGAGAAAGRPGASALVDGAGRLTYAELAAAVRAGLATLAGRGIGAGDGVVLVSGNTRHGVIAYHALARAGVTLVVLDRRCGEADLLVALDSLPAGAPVLLPTAEADRLAGALTGVPVVPLELFGAASAAAPSTASPTASAEPGNEPEPFPEPDRDRPAVVLFSSGTTSRPKGVVHSLNTLTAGARNMAQVTGADENTVAFLVSPLTSITGIMQLHLAADTHATLVLEDAFSPRESLARMNAVGATLLGGAPVIAERLLRAAGAPRGGPGGGGAGGGRGGGP